MRKKETERIERENHAFAKRLFDRQAVVTKKTHDASFNQHLKYRNQILKMGAGKKPRAQTRGSTAQMMGLSAAGTRQDFTE